MSNNLYLIAYHRGTKTIFTKARWVKKSRQRPSLRERFMRERIKECIETPTWVYEDILYPKTRRVCYLEEYGTAQYTKYTKVVLEKKKRHFFVITAYRPNYIKEKGKTKLLHSKKTSTQ